MTEDYLYEYSHKVKHQMTIEKKDGVVEQHLDPPPEHFTLSAGPAAPFVVQLATPSEASTPSAKRGRSPSSTQTPPNEKYAKSINKLKKYAEDLTQILPPTIAEAWGRDQCVICQALAAITGLWGTFWGHGCV